MPWATINFIFVHFLDVAKLDPLGLGEADLDDSIPQELRDYSKDDMDKVIEYWRIWVEF